MYDDITVWSSYFEDIEAEEREQEENEIKYLAQKANVQW